MDPRYLNLSHDDMKRSSLMKISSVSVFDVVLPAPGITMNSVFDFSLFFTLPVCMVSPNLLKWECKIFIALHASVRLRRMGTASST